MSFIGKNIKKIRHIKKLTQTEFAEVFNIKRASIGAYEEERADPKIDTLISIANYFSISLDHLITKELTVNDLYGFDIFKEGLPKTNYNNLKTKNQIKLTEVPLLKENDREIILETNFNYTLLNGNPKLILPNIKAKEPFALELVYEDINSLSLSKYQKGDIIVCYLEQASLKLQTDFIQIKNQKIEIKLIEESENLSINHNLKQYYPIVAAIQLNKRIDLTWTNKFKELDKRLKAVEEKLSK